MIEWLQIPAERRRLILDLASREQGLPGIAIEKDWWVTLVLQAVFETKWSPNLVFKGGTSLSKAWGLIQRFSEDIDLSIDREVLGFSENFVSKAQVAKLRKKAFDFVSNDFKKELEQTLLQMGVPKDEFELSALPDNDEDRDPQKLILNYHSVLESNNYIQSRVLLEIGARSLREPSEQRIIRTIMHESNPDRPYSGIPFPVMTILPKKTFLEKAFLLHEEFRKPQEKIRVDRLSRHLYDLERMMDSEYITAIFNDLEFYQSVLKHRKEFNAIRGLDYSFHEPEHLHFIPPAPVIKKWENDYATMRANMIYGEAPGFDELINRMHELQNRFQLLARTELDDKLVALGLDKKTLVKGITEIKKMSLPDNAYAEGAQIEIPFTLNDVQFMLHFARKNGNLLFLKVEAR